MLSQRGLNEVLLTYDHYPTRGLQVSFHTVSVLYVVPVELSFLSRQIHHTRVQLYSKCPPLYSLRQAYQDATRIDLQEQ